MSGLSEIRPYFRTHMDALGYKEHKDGFNVENIPSTLMNKAYHIANPTGGRRGPYGNEYQEIEQDLVLSVFFKGFRNVGTSIDTVMVSYDAILTRLLSNDNRLGDNLKNISLESMAMLPIDESNDNAILLELTFTCLVYICT